MTKKPRICEHEERHMYEIAEKQVCATPGSWHIVAQIVRYLNNKPACAKCAKGK